MRRDFEAQHRQRFGFVSPEKRVFVAAIEVEAAGGGALPLARGQGQGRHRRASMQAAARHPSPRPAKTGERATATTRFFSAGAWHDAPSCRREQLPLGQRIAGPALVIEPHQTVVVEPGWRLDGHAPATISS